MPGGRMKERNPPLSWNPSRQGACGQENADEEGLGTVSAITVIDVCAKAITAMMGDRVIEQGLLNR